MKIVVQTPLACEEGFEIARLWSGLLRKNMGLVKDGNTEIVIRFPKWGLVGLNPFSYRYLHHLNAKEILHGIMQAEKEGFDAAMISCFYDPMLWEARQAVNIPVIGPAEASMHMATMMGVKFGVITISQEAACEMEEEIARYGLRERAVRIRAVQASYEEQMGALFNARDGIESFKQAAREAIADGAEILIPGCMVMAPTLRLAPGCESEYPNGLTEVDGVPVMDVIGATVKLAEVLVSLKKAGSAWISRKGLFAQPRPEYLEMAQMVLKYDGPGCWSD
jgi:Asp/Glu/hydantoin racemase